MSEVNWADIRKDYESGMSLRKVAAKHSVSKTYLIEKRDREQWNRPGQPPIQTDHRPPSENTGGKTRDVNAAQKVALALQLRAQKLTYDEIAVRCGYASRGAAHNAVQRELERTIPENIEEMRREELYMLDVGHGECWELFMNKNNTWRLSAYDRILETSKDRRKLMGLDVKPDDILDGVTIVRQYDVEIGKV